MKKRIFSIFVAAALCACCTVALAEGEAVSVDVTDIVVSAIGLVASLLSAAAGYAWKKWVQPWLKQHQLLDAAGIVVDAVEAIFGRYAGDEKWAAAVERMREKGWDVDSTEVLDALHAAWKRLDLSQMASGEKKPDEGGA